MKKTLSLFSLFFALAPFASAAISVQSHWRMGEEAGDTNGRLDSVGGRHFNVSAGPVEFSGGVAPANIGSAVAVNARNLGGRAGFYGPNTTSFMPSDNWGIEMWLRSANTGQNIDLLRVQGGGPLNGHLKVGQLGGNWAASYHNVAWIGAVGGAGQPVTAEEWTHLAVVRDAGVTSLYLNGVAQAGTTGGTPLWGSSLHLGVLPGGASGWNGDFDEVRAFTFAPGAFDATSDFLTIPEPHTSVLFVLGAIPLLGFRRRLAA
jgi:hypothetical protein